MLLALALAPFGRMAAAEAKAMPHHAAMAMPGHCAGQPQPDQDRHPATIDCMMACAAMAPHAATDFVPPTVAHAEPASAPALILAGILPEAEPPPPRLS
jgi:hypothetical protein